MLFDKLKQLFNLIAFSSNTRLKDGTELVVEGDLKEGVKVFVVTSDGNIPLPDGSYELENKKLITVADGLITTVDDVPEDPDEESSVEAALPEDEVETPPAEPETEDEPDLISILDEKVKEIDERLSKLEESLLARTKKDEELSNENSSLKEKVSEIETKLSKMDGAAPVKKLNSEIDYSLSVDDETARRMKILAEHKKVLKNN
jgi:Mg2+ and Co2+ transporter CorA